MIVYHFVYSVISYVGRRIRRSSLGPKTMRIFFLKCCLKCTRGGCRAAAAPQAFPLRCCEQQERARRSSGRRARARGAGDARAVRCPVGGYCDAFSASAPGVYWARVGYGARLTSRGREGGRSQVGVAGSDARSLPRFLPSCSKEDDPSSVVARERLHHYRPQPKPDRQSSSSSECEVSHETCK